MCPCCCVCFRRLWFVGEPNTVRRCWRWKLTDIEFRHRPTVDDDLTSAPSALKNSPSNKLERCVSFCRFCTKKVKWSIIMFRMTVTLLALRVFGETNSWGDGSYLPHIIITLIPSYFTSFLRVRNSTLWCCCFEWNLSTCKILVENLRKNASMNAVSQ